MKWLETTLGEQCELYQPKTLAKSELKEQGKYYVYGANGIIGMHDEFNHAESEVLITCRGATCGTINVSKPMSWINGNAMVVKPMRDNICKKFLSRYLQYIDMSGVITGAAQPQITRQSLSPLKIKLPPLAEQRRIAEILDKANEIKAKREQAIVKLDELADNTFVHLFEKNKKYEYQKLSNLCDLITDGTHYTPIYSNEGVVFLSAKNVTSGKVDWVNIKHIPQSLHIELEKRVKPKIGDVLLAKNGTTGVAAIVDRDITFDIYVSLALLRPGNKITTEFLHASLNSKITKRQFNSALKGIGVPNLHLVDIRNTTIPLPNLEEQGAFLKIIQKINVNRELEVRSLKSINNLINSLQNQAFTTGFSA